MLKDIVSENAANFRISVQISKKAHNFGNKFLSAGTRSTLQTRVQITYKDSIWISKKVFTVQAYYMRFMESMGISYNVYNI